MPHCTLRFTKSFALAAIILAGAAIASGCSTSYTVPAGANLRAFSAENGTANLDASADQEAAAAGPVARVPTAKFPVTIATARVQSPEFSSRRERYCNRGSYTIITTREIEEETKLKEFAANPQIRGIVPINALMLSELGDPNEEIREAARTVGADMILLYTFDATTQTDHHVPELSVLTLGLAPEGEAVAVCTASAILIDARTGYTDCVAEATDRQKRLTSAWSSGSAENKAHRKAQRNAFKELTESLKENWSEVVANYAAPQSASAASPG